MKKTVLTIWMTVVSVVAAWAQASPALPFITIDRNPASLAMGATQANKALYNPAVTALTGSDVAFSFQSWAPGGAKSTNLNLLGGFKFGKFGLNVLGAYQAGEAYETMDASGNTGSKFTPSDLLIGLGFGFAFTDNLSAGINLKMASSTLAAKDATYTSFAGDIFVTYATKELKATAGIASLGLPIKSGDKSYGLPASAKAGADYKFAFGTSAVNLAADFDFFFTGGIGLGIGAQYGWNDMVFVRAGYHLGTGNAPIPSFASIGLGGKFFGVHVDLSFLTASPVLGNTIAIGLGYSF